MPMPQYNGPMYSQGPTAVGPYNLQGYQSTFGYNPQQTYLPQTRTRHSPLAGSHKEAAMTHMTKDLDGICDMKDSLMSKVRGKMDDLDVERSTIQDVQGMDMMINMIHHLAEAEKCCWEACYYKTVVKAMKEGDDREDRDEDEDDDEEWIEHDDMPNRNRTSSGRFRRRNTVGRRYPGNERRDWGGDMGSDGGTLQHGDMTTMTPDEQLNHLKMDVETMWRDATPEQRKRIKESLTKWSTTLTV